MSYPVGYRSNPYNKSIGMGFQNPVSRGQLATLGTPSTLPANAPLGTPSSASPFVAQNVARAAGGWKNLPAPGQVPNLPAGLTKALARKLLPDLLELPAEWLSNWWQLHQQDQPFAYNHPSDAGLL